MACIVLHNKIIPLVICIQHKGWAESYIHQTVLELAKLWPLVIEPVSVRYVWQLINDGAILGFIGIIFKIVLICPLDNNLHVTSLTCSLYYAVIYSLSAPYIICLTYIYIWSSVIVWEIRILNVCLVPRAQMSKLRSSSTGTILSAIGHW